MLPGPGASSETTRLVVQSVIPPLRPSGTLDLPTVVILRRFVP